MGSFYWKFNKDSCGGVNFPQKITLGFESLFLNKTPTPFMVVHMSNKISYLTPLTMGGLPFHDGA